MEAWEPLNFPKYLLFQTYATRQDAAAAGLTVPDWNQNRPPKYWADPSPVEMFKLDGVPMTLYQYAFFGKLDTNQCGVLEPLVLTVDEAKTVNIPPTGTGMTNVPGADKTPRPVPMKPLGDRQKLMRPSPFGGFQVRNLDVPLPGATAGAFTDEDRAVLNRIAAKLGA